MLPRKESFPWLRKTRHLFGPTSIHPRRLAALLLLKWLEFDQFGMRKRRSFWYAPAHLHVVCASASHFFMRRYRSDFYAHAQLIFYLCAWHLFGTLLLKFHLRHILNFFSGNFFLFFNNLQLSFLLSKTSFVTITLHSFKTYFMSVN